MVFGLCYVHKIVFVAFKSTVFSISPLQFHIGKEKSSGTLTNRQGNHKWLYFFFIVEYVNSISLRIISSFLVLNLSSPTDESEAQQNHSMMIKKK